VLSVVDDDTSVRIATGRLIRSVGFTVEMFTSGEEFLRHGSLQETSCLILDVHMPGMSGLQLQSHLAAVGHRIPIIFITAYPDQRIRALALQAGAMDFLYKPFSYEALLSAIRLTLKVGDGEGSLVSHDG
jgi:FixJ family two-component response regulator